VAFLSGLSASHFLLDLSGLSLLEHAFPADAVGSAFNEDVDELSLTLAKSVGVGDIPGATDGVGVDTTATTGLEAELCTLVLEVFTGREEREFDHGTGAESSSQVGWASKDETQMVVVHEIVSCTREHFLDDLGGLGESFEDRDNTITLLHGDDSHVVLLIEPDEESLVGVVEDTTGVGPVATAS